MIIKKDEQTIKGNGRTHEKKKRREVWTVIRSLKER
jgi:hypothetical protein